MLFKKQVMTIVGNFVLELIINYDQIDDPKNLCFIQCWGIP